MRYLEAFCAGDIDELGSLLAPDLRFVGPFHEFDSSAAYLECLAADPPAECSYHVLSRMEKGDSAAVFYEYVKPQRSTTIAQLFRVRNGRISEILVIFDGRDFA